MKTLQIYLEAELTNHIEERPFSNLKEWLDLRNGSLFDHNFRDIYFKSAEDYLSFLKDVEPPKKLDKYLFD